MWTRCRKLMRRVSSLSTRTATKTATNRQMKPETEVSAPPLPPLQEDHTVEASEACAKRELGLQVRQGSTHPVEQSHDVATSLASVAVPRPSDDGAGDALDVLDTVPTDKRPPGPKVYVAYRPADAPQPVTESPPWVRPTPSPTPGYAPVAVSVDPPATAAKVEDATSDVDSNDNGRYKAFNPNLMRGTRPDLRQTLSASSFTSATASLIPPDCACTPIPHEDRESLETFYTGWIAERQATAEAAGGSCPAGPGTELPPLPPPYPPNVLEPRELAEGNPYYNGASGGDITTSSRSDTVPATVARPVVSPLATETEATEGEKLQLAAPTVVADKDDGESSMVSVDDSDSLFLLKDTAAHMRSEVFLSPDDVKKAKELETGPKRNTDPLRRPSFSVTPLPFFPKWSAPRPGTRYRGNSCSASNRGGRSSNSSSGGLNETKDHANNIPDIPEDEEPPLEERKDFSVATNGGILSDYSGLGFGGEDDEDDEDDDAASMIVEVSFPSSRPPRACSVSTTASSAETSSTAITSPAPGTPVASPRSSCSSSHSYIRRKPLPSNKDDRADLPSRTPSPQQQLPAASAAPPLVRQSVQHFAHEPSPAPQLMATAMAALARPEPALVRQRPQSADQQYRRRKERDGAGTDQPRSQSWSPGDDGAAPADRQSARIVQRQRQRRQGATTAAPVAATAAAVAPSSPGATAMMAVADHDAGRPSWSSSGENGVAALSGQPQQRQQQQQQQPEQRNPTAMQQEQQQHRQPRINQSSPAPSVAIAASPQSQTGPLRSGHRHSKIVTSLANLFRADRPYTSGLNLG